MRQEPFGKRRARQTVAAVLVALFAVSSTGTARAQGYVAPPPAPTGVSLAAPGALDARYLGDYRAPHLAMIRPKRAAGQIKLGVGIALAGVGFLMMIVGGAMATVEDLTPGADFGWYHPYRPGAYYAVGVGAGALIVVGALTASGAVSLTEARSHENAIGGLVVSFAR